MSISEIDNVYHRNVDSVDVTIILFENHEMLLVGAKRVPAKKDVPSPISRGQAGKGIEAAFAQFRFARQRLARLGDPRKVTTTVESEVNGMKVVFQDCRKSRPQEAPRPYFRHHGNHRHSLREHPYGVLNLISRVALHVMVPIFVGIAAGMMASLVGMLIGQFLVIVINKVRGRDGEDEMDETMVVPIEGNWSESKGLLMADADLPAYEEAPRYEDVVAVVVDDEKK